MAVLGIGKPSPTQQAQQLADRALSSSEEAILAAAERLGLRKAAPAHASGDDAWAFTSGLLFGGIAAAAAAVLLAPTDGQTLRTRLMARIDELLGRTPAAESPFESGGQMPAAEAATGPSAGASAAPSPAASAA